MNEQKQAQITSHREEILLRQFSFQKLSLLITRDTNNNFFFW